MEKVDVAIVGAGIAGCQAARDLGLAGRSVILADRKPAERLGHDWWDAVKVDVFDEVGIPRPKAPELMKNADRVVMYPPLESIEMVVADAPEKLHIDRLLFAQRQLEMAREAGARFMEKTSAKAPIVENGRVKGVILEKENGEKLEVRANITIDASGLNGALRKQVPANPMFPRYVDRRDTFVTYREIRRLTSDSKDCMAIFGKDNGVIWINRAQDGLVDFFAGAINFPGRPNPSATVRNLISKTKDAGEFKRGGYGAPIPVRHCFDAFVSPGFMLCGDSACQCNPIDGSGIASSLRAAHHAARTAVQALDNNSFEIRDLWPYVAAYKRTQGSQLVTFKAIQMFLVSEPKHLLELLFTREVVRPKEFWGTGEPKKDTVCEQIAKLLRIIDHPMFMLRLVNGMTAAKELSAHFTTFPEVYDERRFEEWKNRTTSLFNKIPGAGK